VAVESKLRLASVGLLGNGVLHALFRLSLDLAPVSDFFLLKLKTKYINFFFFYGPPHAAAGPSGGLGH
jgi:hypothetical protein